MCIRDRSTAEDVVCNVGVAHAAGTFPQTVGQPDGLQLHLPARRAVSYTHLDVYKRQNLFHDDTTG